MANYVNEIIRDSRQFVPTAVNPSTFIVQNASGVFPEITVLPKFRTPTTAIPKVGFTLETVKNVATPIAAQKVTVNNNYLPSSSLVDSMGNYRPNKLKKTVNYQFAVNTPINQTLVEDRFLLYNNSNDILSNRNPFTDPSLALEVWDNAVNRKMRVVK